MRRIIITKMQTENSEEKLFTCLLEENRLIEAAVDDAGEDPLTVGSIYIGKVSRIVRGISAAFVEVRPNVMCYYPLNKRQNPIYVKKGRSRNLEAGDEIVVQISREPVKTKEAKISSNLNFTGRYLVLTSENRNINVSSKLTKEQKKHYQELFSDIPDRDYGLIVRTNAAEVPDETILSERTDLEKTYHEVLAAAPHRTCFSCLYSGDVSWKKFLRGTYLLQPCEIITDIAEIYQQIVSVKNKYPDFEKAAVRFYQDDRIALCKVWNLEKELQRALQRKVWLKSGGYLVIDPTEALTAIDVNSGKSIGKKHAEEHLKRINLEAAAEVARQMRLRNLSGMILIDFINMQTPEEEEEILSALRKAVKSDPIPVQVLDMTQLGLVEVTRKKVEKTLQEQLTKR